MLNAGFLRRFLSATEDGSSTFIRYVGRLMLPALRLASDGAAIRIMVYVP
jgi:hypothetical protein